MRLKFVPALLAAAALGFATAASPTPATVTINASVNDACEITDAPSIDFDYQAADLAAVTGESLVSVRCNLATEPFLGYWDDTQWNADGTVDLAGAGGVLKVMLETDFEPTVAQSNDADGSRYTYGVTATAAAGQWTAASGAYSATVDYYIGW